MEDFQGKSPHRPFQNDTDIRIITLLPNSRFNAPVECELQHITLEADANYEAISYNWGDPKITEPILLDGQPYPVTVNICICLRYLRLEERQRRLWVDSICINQTDTKERSHQINKMRDIYKLASQVLIWIGDYDPFTRSHVKRLFDFMKDMVLSKKYEKDAETTATIGFDELWRRQQEIREFLAPRHWFERMWIIQEVCVRKRLHLNNLKDTAVVICGHLQLPLFYVKMSESLWSRPEGRSQLGLPAVCPTLSPLFLIWNNHREMVEYALPCPVGRQVAWILTLAAELFHATDPRDFIFSVVGLLVCPETPPQLLPDYDKTVSQVLTESAAYVIESGTMDIIQFNSMRTKDLPSWVPDWRYKAHIHINSLFPPSYDAYVKISDGLVMEVDILPFTKVIHVGPAYQEIDTTRDPVCAWREFFLDLQDSLHSQTYRSDSHCNFGQAICHLLLVYDMRAKFIDDRSWHMSALKDSPMIFSPIGHSARSCPGLPNTLGRLFEGEMWKSVGESISHKHLFRCADGSVGIMGQPFVQPEDGDLICSIRGACGEFVLRPFKDGYKIVGICERTVKCYDSKMSDVGLEWWIGSGHILDVLMPLWETSQLERCFIY